MGNRATLVKVDRGTQPLQRTKRTVQVTTLTNQATHAEILHRIFTYPQSASHEDILGLQSLAGNHAATHFIQTKLTVGAAGDAYEQEADRAAAQVMSGGLSSDQSSRPAQDQEEDGNATGPVGPTPRVQRDATPIGRARSGAGFAVGSETESRLMAQRGYGEQLPAPLQTEMETRLGTDFHSVRVHADLQSADMNRAFASQAFTYGHDIYLGKGHTNLHTRQGKQLMAHELAHVVQQTGLANRRLQRWSMGIKGEGHEVLTRESLRRSGFTEEEINKQFGGQDAFTAGSQWNDLPGGYLASTAIVGIGPSTAITYRSHNKDLQFLHGMAEAQQKASTTVDYMLAWAQFCYTIAQGNGGIGKDTLLTDLPIPLISNLFPSKDYQGKTVAWLFMENDANRLKAVAIGSMLHMIQDTFCAAHTQRARKKPGESIGKIRAFQDYGKQDHARHEKADEVVKVKDQMPWYKSNKLNDAASIGATVGAQDAVEVGAMVLARLRANAPWLVVKSYLMGDVFVLEEGSANKGATVTRHFRQSAHEEFRKRLPFYFTWSPPLRAVVEASQAYDTLLEYNSGVGIQYEKEKVAVQTVTDAIAAWRHSNYSNDTSIHGEAKAKDAITFLANKMREDLTDIEKDIQQDKSSKQEVKK